MKGKKLLPMVRKKADIFDAIKLVSSGLLSLDPSADIYPLTEFLQWPENLSLSTLFPEELDCFREKIQENEHNSDSEWEPDSDSDNCSEPESDDDRSMFDASDDGLWLVFSNKVSILLRYVF